MTTPELTEDRLNESTWKEYWDQYHVSVRTSGVQTFDRDSFCIRIEPQKGYRVRIYIGETDQWETAVRHVVLMVDKA